MCANEARLGLYRHFKGNIYELVAIARYSEDADVKMAVYRSRANADEYWVRPLSMWLETVERDGVTVPRFEYIGDEK